MSGRVGEGEKATVRIRVHMELEVDPLGMEAAMRVFALSRAFPREEIYSLTDQLRRSSRSVCANIAEAWRKRRYPAAFVSKLSEAEAEAAETQVWLQFAVKCDYLEAEAARALYTVYGHIIGKIVVMIQHPGRWTLPFTTRTPRP